MSNRLGHRRTQLENFEFLLTLLPLSLLELSVRRLDWVEVDLFYLAAVVAVSAEVHLWFPHLEWLDERVRLLKINVLVLLPGGGVICSATSLRRC